MLVDEDLQSPAVKDLEALDDEYLGLEQELEREMWRLEERFRPQFRQMHTQRSLVLQKGSSPTRSLATYAPATPGLPGFWRKVLKTSYEFEQDIERYDEPVLDFLENIHSEPLDEQCLDRGFRIRFHFVPNPFISNDVLEKVYHFSRKNVYSPSRCTKIESMPIAWRVGKNVTVEIVSKGTYRGHRRSAKPKREEVPRPSFFRRFFRNLGGDAAIPEEELEDDEEDSEDLMSYLIDDDVEQARALLDHLIPRAVRWYTGEAVEGDGESDEGEESESEADDDEVCSSETDPEEEEGCAAGGSQDARGPRSLGGKGNKIARKAGKGS